jgi:hypothetical protein
MPLASFSTAEGSGVLVGDLDVGPRESIGVGGVTVVSGVANPALGGVWGRARVLSGDRPEL